MRVSLPITIWWRPDRRINKCAAARPSCIAISLVIGSRLATPRTPSVPNNLRMVCLHRFDRLLANRGCHPHDILHTLHVMDTKDSSATVDCHRHRRRCRPLALLHWTVDKLPKEPLVRDSDQQGTFKLQEMTQLR